MENLALHAALRMAFVPFRVESDEESYHEITTENAHARFAQADDHLSTRIVQPVQHGLSNHMGKDGGHSGTSARKKMYRNTSIGEVRSTSDLKFELGRGKARCYGTARPGVAP